MRRLRRSIGIGAALSFLLLGAPTGGAAAAQGDAPTSAQAGQGEFEPGYEVIRTFAGRGESGSDGDGGPATEARLFPVDVAVDDGGNVYIADSNVVRKVDSDGTITIFAGGGHLWANEAEGGPATDARLIGVSSVATDDFGNVYVGTGGAARVDGTFRRDYRVRKVDSEGIVTTVAGTGQFGRPGNGTDGPATEAAVKPEGLTVDGEGLVYIVERDRVRMVDSDGIIRHVAGGAPASFGGHNGDGGPASEAELTFAEDAEFDQQGNLFIASRGGNDQPSTVRMVDNDGIITTVAGGGGPDDPLGNGGLATDARLDGAVGVAVAAAGNLYIAEGNRIREVDTDGIISTLAGDGIAGWQGDEQEENVPPSEARLNAPQGVAVDRAIGPEGETQGLLIADSFNYRVRQVTRVPSLLGVTKAGAPNPVNIDQELVYTVEVANHGLAGTATGVTLADTLPNEVAFLSATATQGSCSEAVGTVTCDLGTLAEGDRVTVQITVDPLTAGVVVKNTATVAANEDDPFTKNNTTSSATAVGDAGCGEVITGDAILDEDLGPCPQNGIVVGASNITIDLGGHHVFGFRQFSEADVEQYDFLGTGDEAGVRITDHTGVTVANGTVTDFSAGVRLEGGGGHTVRNLSLRENIGVDAGPVGDEGAADFPFLGDGVFVWDSVENLVVDNKIVGNGRYSGVFVGGFEAHNNTIQRNVVEDTIGLDARYIPSGQGIMVNAAGLGGTQGTMISGNQFLENVVRRNASAGIASVNNRAGTIIGNTIEHNGTTNAGGNGIGISAGFGITDARLDLTIGRNQVHGNALNGIELRGMPGMSPYPDEVRVLNNNVSGSGGLDLRDSHETCNNNVWRNNSWSASGYSPECTTTGGKGPQARVRPDTARPEAELPSRFPQPQEPPAG